MWRVGIWIGTYSVVLAWSAWQPKDRLTWWMEVAPALIAAVILVATRKRFPLTPLAYWLILVHCLILMVGGHYTYAEVPLFDWLREPMGWTRNNYDKLGHFAQGFVPAIIAREVISRCSPLREGPWLTTFALCFVLAFSALYELIEWLAAVLIGTGADAFLGTQGFVWDTQSDMLLALIGGIVSLLLLTHLHKRQLSRTLPSCQKSAHLPV